MTSWWYVGRHLLGRCRVLLAAAMVLLSGCAASPPVRQAVEPVFYPRPPGVPRVQFLTSFSTSSDLSGAESRFRTFIAGPQEERPIVKPYGLAVWGSKIYVCDTVLAALVVLDLEEKQLSYVVPVGPGRLSKPINITIDHDGTKYITDTSRGVVVILDSQDQYSGELRAADGMRPTDVAIGDTRLYVADVENSRVRVWDKETREEIFTIPLVTEATAQSKLFSPVNLALDRDNNLYVSDLGASRVQKYDRDGHYVRTFGSLGDTPGQFVRPKGIAVDDDGLLYVVDAATEVVQIFDSQGELVLFFGEPRGSGFSLGLPAQVQVSETLIPYFASFADPSFELRSIVLVTSQYGNHKVSVFGMGR